MMKKITFILSLLWGIGMPMAWSQTANTYANEEVARTEDYGIGNKYQKDFLLFLNLVETQHPMAKCEKLPWNMASVRRKGYKEAAAIDNDADFQLFLQSILATLQDGHSVVPAAFNSEWVYPLSVFIDENGMYIRSIQAGEGRCIGKKVQAINGKKLSLAAKQFCKIFSACNQYEQQKLFRKNIASFALWQHSGLCNSDSSLLLTFTDKTTVQIWPKQLLDVKMDGQRAPIANTPRVVSKMPFDYRMYADKGICYLQFDQCQDRNTLRAQHTKLTEGQRVQLEESLGKYPVWSEFLDSMFADIQKQGIRTLVVDVRENNGGNSLLCNELMLRLSAKPILSHKRIDAQTPYTAGALYMEGSENSARKAFDGQVVFIQGQNTYSSAGLLMTYATDNHIGTVIGDCGSYSPTHYGDVKTWYLPNTHTAIVLSSARFLRPNESVKEKFLRPSVYLPASHEEEANGTDRCWEWILKNCQ